MVNRKADDPIRTCRKLESGLRIGQEGIRACQLGQFAAPLFWTADEAKTLDISKEMIEEKRRWLFECLNDDHSDIPCKTCHMVGTRPFREVDFSRLGHIDFAPVSICNLRCIFCGYTKHNAFHGAQYDSLSILRNFTPEDVTWDSTVDFNGGEPSLLPDLDEYLGFFESRRIRVLLYTNAVAFRQSIFDGLAKGTLRWVVTSLDAGSPSSFLRLKQRDHYVQVLENLTRYAAAGSRGGGMLAVKYIFCDDNCGEDDIVGFAYAMLAIRPQRVWLTVDFEPLCESGDYDYSRHVEAYARLYWLLKKHGLEPVHYNDTHLAAISVQGKLLMDSIRSEILRTAPAVDSADLCLDDFRQSNHGGIGSVGTFSLNPFRTSGLPHQPENETLAGKRVMLAPTCPATRALLEVPAVRAANILGFLDRDAVLWGKDVEGIPVHGYHAIGEQRPDLVLVAAPQQHRAEILRAVAEQCGSSIQVYEHTQAGSEERPKS